LSVPYDVRRASVYRHLPGARCKDCGSIVSVAEAAYRIETWDYNTVFLCYCPRCFRPDRADHYARYVGQLLGADGEQLIDQVMGGQWEEPDHEV